MYLQKVVEVENFQREFVYFIDQIFIVDDEYEFVSLDVIFEVFVLRVDKVKFEVVFEDL